jgi:hypothetical protein
MAKKRAKKAAPAASCSTKGGCCCGKKSLWALFGAVLSALGLLLVVGGVLFQVKAGSLWWVFLKYFAGLVLLMIGAKCKMKAFCCH